MTAPRLLHPPYRRVAWKNGLGSTLEIATDASETGGTWTWRLSFADVPVRGPFSRFPGIDRHLAMLEGRGLVLERGAERLNVPREGPAVAFAGEDDIVGAPSGDGVRDANLMIDRTRWSGSLELRRVTEPRSISVDSDLTLIHLVRTEQAARFTVGEASGIMGQHSTLVAHGSVSMHAEHCTLVIARLASRIEST